MPAREDDAKRLRAVFGRAIRPTIAVSSSEIALEAQKVAGRLSISGVQPKLSLRLDGDRLVSAARDGRFILKPQTQDFDELPQNESLCMSLGQLFDLRVAAEHAERQIGKLTGLRDSFLEMIGASRLRDELRERLAGIVTKRVARLG